jgi:aminoglycoside phosphotransferase (APT) family kinase protein
VISAAIALEVGISETPGVDMHPNQLTISVATVRELLDEQFPEWIDLPVRRVASQGTVNAIFRIGDSLAARFPLQGTDAQATRESLEREAQAARTLLGRTPFATPEPVALGDPGAGYPLPWSVQTWLPGTVATDADPGGSVEFAHDLGVFIRCVRTIDVAGRSFTGSGRGGDLRSHDAWVEMCLRRSEGMVDVPRLRRMWAEFREAPRIDAPDVMTHGDLIGGNILVSDDRLWGIIDVGGLGPADPALDLVCAWHLLETNPRQILRDDLGCDDAAWMRGKAWAFEQAMGAIWYYVESNPTMSLMGRRTLGRIVAADD